MKSEQYEQARKERYAKRKKAHEELCPPHEPDGQTKRLRKERKDIRNRKTAMCLGCGKPDHSCTCQDHKKPHAETQITYNW